MMELIIRNQRGEELSLVNNPIFALINIDGMTKVTGSISSVIIGGMDGDDVNNIQAQPRGMIFDLRIRDGVNVEDAAREVLRHFKFKQKVTLIWTQNNKIRQIEGVMEFADMPRFQAGVIIQISIHCEQPFWEDIDFIIQQIDEAIRLHYFTTSPYDMLYFPVDGIPFGEYDMSRTRSFHNSGDVSVGLEIEIIAYKQVTNPIIYDTDGNFFGVGYGSSIKRVRMQEGDIIRITTHKGNKSVKMNGTSILGRIKPHSTWIQMQPGDNTFSINSEEAVIDNMTFLLKYKQRYI